MKQLVLLVLSLSIGLLSFGQNDNQEFGLIVCFHDDVQMERQHVLLEQWFGADNCSCLSERFNTHLIEGDIADESLDQVESSPEVRTALWDFALEPRQRTPNDPQVGEQYYLESINAFDAWDRTTGGITSQGDTAVYAVFEAGFNIGNSDLDTSSLYFNNLEIPNNGIDDDQNGAVDDYYGWNPDKNSDNHFSQDSGDNDHGNAILGIIGAETDNELGVAGLVWDPKFLLVTGNQVSSYIRCVNYIIDQRILYNETNGEQGTFVVAYNMSFGTTGQALRFESVEETLCPYFDTMGFVGIVPVGSTLNSFNSVDDEFIGMRDFPSNCTSEHLIVVTQTDENDIVAGAGYGATSIDIGAPSKDIPTLDQDGVRESLWFGTSFATPQVVGAVGLVYSVLDESMLNLATREPEKVALAVKDIILDNVRKVSLLEGNVSTSGVLDLNAAVNAAMTVTNIAATQESGHPVDVIYDGQTLRFSNLNFNGNNVAKSIRIADMVGREWMAIETAADEEQMEVSGLPAGIYAFSISTGSSMWKSGRIFVR